MLCQNNDEIINSINDFIADLNRLLAKSPSNYLNEFINNLEICLLNKGNFDDSEGKIGKLVDLYNQMCNIYGKDAVKMKEFRECLGDRIPEAKQEQSQVSPQKPNFPETLESTVITENIELNPKKHKHYDIIIAFAEGKSIEWKNLEGEWQDTIYPDFQEKDEYRIREEVRKNYDIMIAFAEGKSIEWKNPNGEWEKVKHPQFIYLNSENEFRIREENIVKNFSMRYNFSTQKLESIENNRNNFGNFRNVSMEIDPYTLEIVSIKLG